MNSVITIVEGTVRGGGRQDGERVKSSYNAASLCSSVPAIVSYYLSTYGGGTGIFLSGCHE